MSIRKMIAALQPSRRILLVAAGTLVFGVFLFLEPVAVFGQVQRSHESQVSEAPSPDAGQSPQPAGQPGWAANPRLKGWVEAAPGGKLNSLPDQASVIEAYGNRLFVEVPESAVNQFQARNLIFHLVPNADVISIGDHRFDIHAGAPSIASDWLAGTENNDSLRPYLIKFNAPIKEPWLEELRASGARIVQYQPHFGYLVFAPQGFEENAGRITQLGYHGEYHPAYKAFSWLRAKAAGEEMITLRVVYFDLPGYREAIDKLVAEGANLRHLTSDRSTSNWNQLHYAIFEGVRTRDLPGILHAPQVYWAEEWFPPELESERAAQIIAGNIPNNQPVTGYSSWLTGLGADGSGVTVTIADTGLDTGNTGTIHEDFAGRVTFATGLCPQNRDLNGHGTNVAAIAVGDPRLPTGTNLKDGGGFFYGMGAAPGASLYFQRALGGSDCGATISVEANVLANDAVGVGGAQIGSHSFTDGSGGGGAYTSQAQAWDARVRDADTSAAGNQPYAVVFSAGNSGPSSGSLTSPKGAKNILTVGASENYDPAQCPGISGCGGAADDIDSLVSFSSRGPADDGRIKPEIVAPGHVISGAISSLATYSCTCDAGGGSGCCASQNLGANKYAAYSGTSQAAPRAGGASAIVFDWYQNQFAAFPSPAMNKAILINGAIDMGAANIPNNDEGWGRINLSSSLQGSTPSVHIDQSAIIGTTGDPGAVSANYFIQDPSQPMNVSMAWTDAPGAVSCNPCLVNNLDLLMTQGVTTWRGNNFTNGISNTNPAMDSINNIETLRLAGGTLNCSSIEFKVRAQTLAGDGLPGNADITDQDFALVISNAATTAGPPVMGVTASGLSNGCDGDDFLDRRETADLSLDLTNIGCSSAFGVEATVSVDSAPAGAVVNVSPAGAVALGQINSETTNQQAWQLTLQDDPSSFCGGIVTLRVDFTDASASTWTEFVDVILDADSFSPVVLNDPADVDNSFSSDGEWNIDNCLVTSPSTSWHMGQSDCSGMVRDASTRDLVFSYSVSATDSLQSLSFQHAFNGYSNATLMDSVQVDIDPENDGTFVTLETWLDGSPGTPTSMTAAGPYDLTPFNATHGTTIKVRFRFQSAASWVGGPNNVAGWDVDDIVFAYDTLSCDGGSCPLCSLPSGLLNNTAADALNCASTGNEITWPQDPGNWGDGAIGTRTYTVYRDGAPLASGSCSGALPFGTTSCVDETASLNFSHNYQVEYLNGCGSGTMTTGASATDQVLAPPPINDGTGGGNPMTISISGGNLTLNWDTQICAIQYNVYMGSMGNYWDHAIFSAAGLDGADSCREPSNSVTFADPGGDIYFLVAAKGNLRESNYGISTVQNPRPYASSACSPP